jgi:hypothetical protein
MSKWHFILFFSLLTSSFLLAQPGIFMMTSGNIHFKSNAPLEVIEATSNELKGAINASEGTFAFTIDIKSFQGFNSPLQREHFNENYLESRKFPKASFTGKIIEKINFDQDGDYTIRAKGELNVHGIARERIIKSQVKVNNGRLYVTSGFTVLLDEHEIAIPKIVYQKIAEEIQVQVSAEFEKK